METNFYPAHESGMAALVVDTERTVHVVWNHNITIIAPNGNTAR